MSCDVCLEVYNSDLKTPLFLPCGHTFCRPCLLSLTKARPFLCPSCRVQHNVQVQALTVNYSLLSIAPLCNYPEYEECTAHSDTLRYWCSTCSLSLCSLCLHSGHPQAHTVKLTHIAAKEEKSKLVKKIETISSTLEHQRKELKEHFVNLDTKMKELFCRNANLETIETDLDNLLGDIQKATNMTSIKNLEKAVEDFKPVGEWLSRGDDKASSGSVKDSQKAEAVQLQDEKQESSAHSQRNQDTTQAGGGAVMDYRDGRMVLRCLAEPETKMLFLQMPSEVFLELSAGGERLGSIYITLWSHMRLAQQFLALCMGTMGLSFLGMKASHKTSSFIFFRFGASGNCHGIQAPLLTNLEWVPQRTKPAELGGHVVGIDGNKNMAFGVCTANQIASNVPCTPFGAVSSGLDVVRDAIQHDLITEVTVSCCGVVLHGFASSVNTPAQ